MSEPCNRYEGVAARPDGGEHDIRDEHSRFLRLSTLINKRPMERNGVRTDSEQVTSPSTGNRNPAGHSEILDLGPSHGRIGEIRAQSSRKLPTRHLPQTQRHRETSLERTSHTPTVTPHITGVQSNTNRPDGTIHNRIAVCSPSIEQRASPPNMNI